MSKHISGRLWLWLALAALAAGGIAAGCRLGRPEFREEWLRPIRTPPGPLQETDKLNWAEMCLAPGQAEGWLPGQYYPQAGEQGSSSVAKKASAKCCDYSSVDTSPRPC
jgi:hypothetical protein